MRRVHFRCIYTACTIDGAIKHRRSLLAAMGGIYPQRKTRLLLKAPLAQLLTDSLRTINKSAPSSNSSCNNAITCVYQGNSSRKHYFLRIFQRLPSRGSRTVNHWHTPDPESFREWNAITNLSVLCQKGWLRLTFVLQNDIFQRKGTVTQKMHRHTSKTRMSSVQLCLCATICRSANLSIRTYLTTMKPALRICRPREE